MKQRTNRVPTRTWTLIGALLIGALALGGCNLNVVPQVTPTIAPTRTPDVTTTPPTQIADVPTDLPTETPIPSLTPTLTPSVTRQPVRFLESWTPTPSPTVTPSLTFTPSWTFTPSLTPTPTPTPTLTFTPTDTPIPTNTTVPTNTPSPTDTPPPTQTNTPPPTQTNTPPPTHTATPTDTPPPTQTNTPTDTPIPTLTPTSRPTNTPLPTNTATPTDTPIPTLTPTPRPTDTPAPTNTPLPTHTPIPPSFTPSATATPRPTDTPAPTHTATPIPTPTIPPSPTPLPFVAPSATPFRPTPTNSAIPPSATMLPTRTQTPNDVSFSATMLAMLTAAPALATQPPIPPSPTFDFTLQALEAAGTANAVSTQAFATVQADTTTREAVASAVALAQTAAPLTPDTAQGTAVFSPTGTPFIPATNLPTPTVALALLPTPLPNPGLRSFELRGAGEGVVIDFQLAAGVTDFARNPANPNQYMTVTTGGVLYFVRDFGAGVSGIDRIYAAPFTDFTYNVPDRASNNAAVDSVQWSPDGRFVAYIINGDRENFDGVWVWSPSLGDYGQYVRDCPPEPGCMTVAYRENPPEWESREVIWAPDSRAFMVRLWLPREGRYAFMIGELARRNPERQEPRWIAYYYEHAHWSYNSGSVLVSGRRGADQTQVGIWRVDRATRAETLIYTSPGAWLQDAVDLPDGRIAFFGATSQIAPFTLFAIDANNPGAVRVITPPIGLRAPERLTWNAARTAALLVVPEEYNGILYKRYYVAGIDGSVREITLDVGGALAVEWAG